MVEVISIGAVIPFVSVLTSPESIKESEFVQSYMLYAGLTDPRELVLPLALVFSAAVVFAAVVRILQVWLTQNFSRSVGSELAVSMFHRTLCQPYQSHLTRNSGDILAGIMTKSNNLIGGVLLPSLTLINSAVMTLLITGALVYINPYVSIGALLFIGCIYFGIISLTKSKLAQHSLIMSQKANASMKVLQEGLGGIRDVLLDNSQLTYTKMFEGHYSQFQQASSAIQVISIQPRYIVEASGIVIITIIASFIAPTENTNPSTLPILATIALSAQKLLPVIQQAYAAFTNIRGARSSVEDALQLLEQKIDDSVYFESDSEPCQFLKSVQFHDVSFSYNDSTVEVLKQINYRFERNKSYGILGNTGSGKSTLLDIIMGLLSPTSGDILIDDVPLTNVNKRQWQSKIAHVPQHIFLTDNSVLENIAFGLPRAEIDINRVKKAAEMAQISSVIEKLPQKYETLIGERGVRLSGGQRQRVGIARALYKQAELLVLDEATSALDSETESLVMKTIQHASERITILMVTHRLTTLKKCDKIIEFKDGKIIEISTYDQIINKK